jgi:hypothetical protein
MENINIEDLIASLNIMWKGLALLFGICGFMALAAFLLSKVIKPKKQ